MPAFTTFVGRKADSAIGQEYNTTFATKDMMDIVLRRNDVDSSPRDFQTPGLTKRP